MSKKPIDWGNKARKLRSTDICRGKASFGSKRDFRGWIIEFWGEHSRASIAFERHVAEKIGILSHGLDIWADSATIKLQVKLFNDTLTELGVFK